MAKVKPAELWQKCMDLLFERSDRWGPLNEAMRAAVVVAVEGQTLILGLAGEHQYLRGHLETATNRHQVLTSLKELTGRDLDYELIQGTTIEEWEAHKQARDSRGQKPFRPEAAPPVQGAPKSVEAKQEAAAEGPWAPIMERLHYAYQEIRSRTEPAARAQFLLDILPALAEAESKAARQDEPEERIQRSLTKAVERIANLVDLPPTQVALELLRYQAAAPPAKTPRKKP